MAGRTPYVTGNTIIKWDNVSKHSTTKRHIACRDTHLFSSQPDCIGTVPAAVNKQLSKMNKDVLREMKIKMNIAYCVAKEELPFTKFGPLIMHHKKNSINVSATYDNHVRCAEVIGLIADEMKCELATKVKDTHYLSIMTDGDMDVSTKECEVVYVRLILDGKPVNKLVGQQEVQHAHAKGILEATKAAFDELGADTNGWMKKLIGFGADGATVNMGTREELELAVLTLQKKEPVVAKVYELLHLVWKTYHYSPKSRRELQALGTELGVNVSNITAVDIAVGELKSRFSCLLSGSEDQASNAVKCFRVFNHNAWPENQIQLLDYGIEEVDVLLKHFGDILKKRKKVSSPPDSFVVPVSPVGNEIEKKEIAAMVRSIMREELKQTMEKLQPQLDTLKTEVKQCKDKVIGVEQSLSGALDQVNELEKVCEDLQRACGALRKENKELQEKTERLESYSRRFNITVFGLNKDVEKDNPTEYMSVLLKEVFQENKKLPCQPNVEIAHRVGPATVKGSGSRPMIVRLQRYQAKEAIL
ncbi:hypothetical protein ABVT39_014850 [Epinephelus coioides]